MKFGKRFFEFVFRKLPVAGKMNINYDIEILDDSFKIELLYELPRSWFIQALKHVLKKDAELPNTFHAGQKTFSYATPRIKSTLSKIEKQVKVDLPRFRIVTYKIKDMIFTVKGNIVETKIIVEGLCVS